MTMLVIDKTKEIAILKSMGMRSTGVARLFQVAGLTIGGIGTVLGIAVGLVICVMVRRYGYHLDPQVYLIDRAAGEGERRRGAHDRRVSRWRSASWRRCTRR